MVIVHPWYDRFISTSISLPYFYNHHQNDDFSNYNCSTLDKKHFPSSSFRFDIPKFNFNFDPLPLSNYDSQLSKIKLSLVDYLLNYDYSSMDNSSLKNQIRTSKKWVINPKIDSCFKAISKDILCDLALNYNLATLKNAPTLKKKITDTKKAIYAVDKFIITKSYRLYTTDKQRDQIFKLFDLADSVYNECVDLFNDDSDYFNKKCKNKIRKTVYKSLFGKKQVPFFDTLDKEIDNFYDNLSSIYTNLKNKNITHFTMKHKKNKYIRCISIRKKAISKKGFYIKTFGTISGFDKINIDELYMDCELVYDKYKKIFMFRCPTYCKQKEMINDDREEVVAIDPGEKVFLSYYSLKKFGFIGENMRKRILMLQKKIRKYQSILDKGINKKGKKIRHKNKLRNRIRGYYRRISNIVKELHTKAILYLCRNYKRIMIPKLEIKKIIKNVNKEIKDLSKELKENLNEERTEEIRKKIKKMKNQRRLKKGYKFSLQMLSHYKFIERLESKAREYGTKIIKVSEEYTTLTCTFCGNIKDDIEKTKRIKKCSKCGYTINRDINGARNILIKNIKKISKRL